MVGAQDGLCQEGSCDGMNRSRSVAQFVMVQSIELVLVVVVVAVVVVAEVVVVVSILQ